MDGSDTFLKNYSNFFYQLVIMMWAPGYGCLLFFSLSFAHSSGNGLPTVDLGYEIHQATNFNVCQFNFDRGSS
jgi:hypothetical protein